MLYSRAKRTYHISLTFKDCRTWSEFVQKERAVRKKFVPGISKYADVTEDGAESIAEAAVRMRNGEKVDVEVKRMVEIILDGGII